MNPKSKLQSRLVFAALLAASATLHAAPVIYEPFADSNASLTGNAVGTGLTGTWTATAAWDVLASSSAWGALPTSGNRGQGDAGGAASAAVGSGVLTNPGLLNHGATLWFSLILTTPPSVSGNPDEGFALGTDGLGGTNNVPMGTTGGGNGLGFSIKNGVVSASTWSGGTVGRATDAAGSEGVAGSTTYLVVGQIIWGANSGTADRINLYLPNTSLALGSVVATRTAVLDQSTFDTISFGHKNDSNPLIFDEIRFGATYLDVIGSAPTDAYWDLDDTVAGSGLDDTPEGTWDAANMFWNPVALGTGTALSWTAGQTAVFAAGTDAMGTYGVAVDSTQSIGGLNFEEGTVTLSGGTALDLVPAGGALEVRQPSGTATISTPISQSSGSGALYKEGGGTLTLAGNNTYGSTTFVNAGKLILSGDNSGATGATTVNAGIIQFDAVNSIPGSGRSVTVNAGTVAMFGSALTSVDITSGLGRIVAASPGVIAADNNDGDNFDFNTGGLTAAYFGAVGTVNYTGTLTPNATAKYRLGGGGGTLTMSNTNALTSTNTLTVTGPGKVVLAANNNYSGETKILSGGTLVASSGTSLGTSGLGNATNSYTGTLVLATSSALANTTLISNGAKLTSDGTTARTFSGKVTFNSGNTWILGNATNNGKLTLNNSGGINPGSGTPTFQCDSDIELTTGFQTTGSAFIKTGAGTMTISGNAGTFTGAATVSNGTLSLTGSFTGGTAITTSGSGIFTESSSAVISGAASITQSSSGTSTLAGTNTYTGITRITSGTLLVNSLASGASDSSIGKSNASAAKLVLGGGTLKYAPISAVGGAGATIDRNFTIIGNSTLDASGTGALVFNAPTGDIISPDVTGLGGSWTTTTAVTGLISTADLAVGMRVGGTGIPAGTTIAAITSASAITLSAAPTAGSGASFGYTARTLTLTGTNTDANTIAGNLQNSSAAGAQALSLTKTGIGTWVLSGANTYSGATAVNGGKLLVATGSGTRCASAVTVANTTGCIFGVQLAAANGQWASSSSLTVGGANSQIEVDYNSTAPSTSTSEDPIKVTDLTISGVGTLKVLGVTPSTPAGTYPLINFTGTGPAEADPYTGLTLSLPLGVTGKLTTTANHVNLVIEGGSTYTVTYDGNGSTGGSVPVDGNTYATAATVTVLGNTGSLVNAGLVFTGWNTLATGLGTHYNPAATFSMGSANVTLYADWRTSYQAWLLANGKTDTEANQKEYAFGTTNTGALVLNAGGTSIVTRGQAPIITTTVGSEFVKLTYARLKNSGFTFAAQYSTDLSTWLASNDASLIYNPLAPTGETVVDNGDEMEIVSINFPVFRDTGSGYVKMEANFCRIGVTP